MIGENGSSGVEGEGMGTYGEVVTEEMEVEEVVEEEVGGGGGGEGERWAGG